RKTLESLFGGAPPFEVLIDPAASVVTDRFGTQLFPATGFIDPHGVTRARAAGARDCPTPSAARVAQSPRAPPQCDHEPSPVAHLKTLDLDYNFLSEPVRQRFRDALEGAGVTLYLDEEAEEHEWDDEIHRFVAVGE